MPRPVGMNEAMTFSPWWAHEHKGIHSRVQVTPFYQASTNRGDVGEYFGVGNGKNSFTVGKRYNFDSAGVTLNPVEDPVVSNPADVEGALLTGFQDFRNNAHDAIIPHQFVGTVKFNPDQKIWGARVDLEYCNHAHEGFFFKLGMPFVSVSNSMNMTVADANKVQISVNTDYNGNGSFYTLTDLFAGNINIPASIDPTDRRIGLNKSKIVGRTTQGGLADLDVTLGYRTVTEKNHYASNIRVTIPTGNRPNGCNLFEPVVGNGHHVGLGAGWDLGFQLWQNKDCTMMLDARVQYTYLFKDEEVRMLGVKGFSVIPPLPQYCLMGTTHGAVADGVAIFPAANELTRSVNVTPGSHIDALLDVSFQMRSFVFDVGYNMFWRAREKVAVVSWEDNTFGLLGYTFVTTGSVTTGKNSGSNYFLDGEYLNRKNLDTSVAETPDQLTHKMQVGMTYRGACCSLPVTAGVGGSFEFASSNAALDQYSVWLKGSIGW